jgi:putative endonuclease
VPKSKASSIKSRCDLTKPAAKHPNAFFVYVLGSRRKNDRRTYVGWTIDLKRRLRQHNTGRGAKSTRGREWTLLYSECCGTRSAAMSREWTIKRDRKFRTTLRETIRARREPAKDRVPGDGSGAAAQD